VLKGLSVAINPGVIEARQGVHEGNTVFYEMFPAIPRYFLKYSPIQA
jgi:hypothetical protein